MLGLPEPKQGFAGGNIAPARFIMQNEGVNNSFLQANAGGRCCGISQPGPKGNQVYGSTTLCAEDGDQFQYFPPGCANVMLELGGTVEAGDRLVPDADGKGIALAHTNQTVRTVGATADQNGVAGDFIPVRTVEFEAAILNASSSGSG